MQRRLSERNRIGRASERRRMRTPRHAHLALILAALLFPANMGWAGQAESPKPQSSLPEAPQPHRPVLTKLQALEPCSKKREGNAALDAGAAAAMASNPAHPVLDRSLRPAPCLPIEPFIDWYARFLDGPKVKPMKPKEKGWLAVRNVIDPFNALTIMGLAGIAVASDSHSPYGPGMPGFGRYVGVTYTEDITGEFFGTFLISSLDHQDPHYHRMPNASIPHRIGHAMLQIVWTQGDNGKGMLNYADLGSGAIGIAIGNLYVPGEQTHLSADLERYAVGFATAPAGNLVTEFVPDVAKRIHLRVVFFQQIVNHVAKTGGS